jgi:hypothetical protein
MKKYSLRKRIKKIGGIPMKLGVISASLFALLLSQYKNNPESAEAIKAIAETMTGNKEPEIESVILTMLDVGIDKSKEILQQNPESKTVEKIIEQSLGVKAAEEMIEKAIASAEEFGNPSIETFRFESRGEELWRLSGNETRQPDDESLKDVAWFFPASHLSAYNPNVAGRFTATDSTNVIMACYDAKKKELHVVFSSEFERKVNYDTRHVAPRYYIYPRISGAQWVSMVGTSSLGEWVWNNLIRPKAHCREVWGPKNGGVSGGGLEIQVLALTGARLS